MKVIIFDVDGTLTDGKIYIGNDGEIMKRFDVRDGYGIRDLMPKYHLIPVIITARNSRIVENRCKELGVRYCYQGCHDKVEILDEIAKKLQLMQGSDGIYCEAAYMGDDVIDLPIMKKCGIKGCPSDAVREIKEIADFVSDKSGGNGAVREFIEWIITTLKS